MVRSKHMRTHTGDKTLVQVWFPNSFRCGTDGAQDAGQEDSGELWLFLKLSRVNHDCSPNTAWFPHAGGVRLVAARAIEEGEEITQSYMGDARLALPTHLRRQHLTAWYPS